MNLIVDIGLHVLKLRQPTNLLIFFDFLHLLWYSGLCLDSLFLLLFVSVPPAGRWFVF